MSSFWLSAQSAANTNAQQQPNASSCLDRRTEVRRYLYNIRSSIRKNRCIREHAGPRPTKFHLEFKLDIHDRDVLRTGATRKRWIRKTCRKSIS